MNDDPTTPAKKHSPDTETPDTETETSRDTDVALLGVSVGEGLTIEDMLAEGELKVCDENGNPVPKEVAAAMLDHLRACLNTGRVTFAEGALDGSPLDEDGIKAMLLRDIKGQQLMDDASPSMLIAGEIIAERHRQTEAEGWGPAHDDGHRNGELAIAAACYVLNAADTRPIEPTVIVNFAGRNIMAGRFDLPRLLWPWAWSWWKPKDRRRDLIRAAALIVAEIERLDRSDQPKP